MHIRPLRGVFGGTYVGSGHHRVHHHPFWEIIYQRTGQVATRQGAVVYRMHPGMILIHPPFVEHGDDAEEEYSIFYVQVEAPHEMPWPQLFSDDTHQSIGKVCEAISREWHYNDVHRDDMVALLTQQLDLMLRRAKQREHRSPEEDLVACAQRILEEQYNLPMTMAKLANDLGISKSAFYTQFMAVTGETPKDYVLRLRLKHALAMLRHTNYTLETIAAATGFYSPSHLARHIKGATNESPGAIRKAAHSNFAALATIRSDSESSERSVLVV